MADLLGNKLDKIAVLHFRVGTGNAGVAIPPENLLPSLEYLVDNGYSLVKAGTEPAPDEFNRFNIINYSATPLRSFNNDLALLSNAKFCLINASGLENIADVMGVPTVSYARWHLSMFPYSPKTIIVPALMYDPARERMLTFGEQMLLFKTMPEYWESKNFVWHVPIDRFSVIPPRADELLAATKEAIELGVAPKPWTELQQRFRALDGSGLLSTAEARVSQFFLERFQAHL
ncbi:MAG: TIGR04372 family glycosyltransferase [Burkholderiaceae bacterium]|nr:TIGR04372 family glycosyltransferase [Burkholderiaceae bacterium]